MDETAKEEIEMKEVREAPPQQFRSYYYRFISLAAYDLLIFVSSMCMCYNGSLMPIYAEIYDVQMGDWSLIISYLGLFGVAAVLIVIPCIEKLGVHISLLIGGLGIIAAYWTRTTININYKVSSAASNSLLNFFQPFYQVAITKVSVRWFPPRERVMATFITNISQDLGIFLGFFIPIWYVNPPDNHDDWDIPSIKDDIFNGMLMEAILLTAAFTVTIFTFRERPKTPPSPADDVVSNMKKSQILKGLGILIKNKSFLIVMIGHICFLTTTSLRAGNLGMIFVPFNINPEKAMSYYIMAEILPGVVSTFAVGYFLSRYKKFKLVMYVVCVCMSACYVMNTFLPYMESLAWIIVGGGIQALFLGPELSCVYEFMCELGYPVGEAIIIGIPKFVIPVLLILGQIGMRDMLNHPTKEGAVIFGCIAASVFLLFGIAMLFVKEELRRDRRDTSIMTGITFDDEYLDSFVKSSPSLENEVEMQLTPNTPLLPDYVSINQPETPALDSVDQNE